MANSVENIRSMFTTGAGQVVQEAIANSEKISKHRNEFKAVLKISNNDFEFLELIISEVIKNIIENAGEYELGEAIKDVLSKSETYNTENNYKIIKALCERSPDGYLQNVYVDNHDNPEDLIV